MLKYTLFSRRSWRTLAELKKGLPAIIASAAFGTLGVYLLAPGHAATYATGAETESGTLNGNVSITTDGTSSGGHAVIFGSTPVIQTPFTPLGMRPLPSPLYGVTADDVSNSSELTNSSSHFQHMSATRIVFDTGNAVSDYNSVISQLQPVSYLMGELLDSSEETSISDSAEHTRVASYLNVYGNTVDIWEIGNEVNGNWTGPYSDVETKLVDAYDQASALGKRTALTLYANNFGPNNCGDGTSELTPVQFSQQYVPSSVAQGITYVLLSYYETQCNNVRPPATAVTSYMQQLHAIYPNALLGFGEIGLPSAATSTNQSQAQSIIDYYYGLSPQINLPYYIGGYFYWYYYEDALPYTTKPIWQTLNSALGLY